MKILKSIDLPIKAYMLIFPTAAVERYMEKATVLNLNNHKGNPFANPEKAASDSMRF